MNGISLLRGSPRRRGEISAAFAELSMARRRIARDGARHRLACEECDSPQPYARSNELQPFMKSVLVTLRPPSEKSKTSPSSHRPLARRRGSHPRKPGPLLRPSTRYLRHSYARFQL